MRILIVCALLIIFSVLPRMGYSQEDSLSCCHECVCLFDPTPSGVMISHVHKKRQWMFSYRYMNMNMGNMLIGKQKVSDEYIFTNYLMSAGNMQMDMHMLMGMYGLTNRLTLMGMLNYISSSMDMKMLSGTVHTHNGVSSDKMDMTMKTSGLSDLKVHMLYGLVNRSRHHLLLSAGLSIPSGNVNIKGGSNSMYKDERLPYSMQLGSGTVDVLPGLNYLYQKGKITWSSQITSVIRIGNTKIGYRLGNEITTNHWLAFRWANNFSSSIRLEGSTAEYIKGMDKTLYPGNEPAANPYNYGGQRINGFVGTNFHFTKGFLNGNRIGLEYGMPFYQNLFGPQMGVNSSLYASWNISF